MPAAMLRLVGETWIEDNVAEVTVSVVLPDFVPNIADIVVEPAPTEVARPFASIVAKAGTDEFQVTELVRFWFDPSE